MSWLTGLYHFWHTYGSDIQNGAVVLSAIAAFRIIADTRKTAKRRGTLDLILHQESDSDLIEERIAFNAIKAADTKLSTYGKPNKKSSEQAETLRKVCNIHELTAVAIQERVIDECVYRRWFNGTYIADYEAVKDYIVEVRKTWNNPKLFREFEKTALRWKEDVDWDAPPGWFARKWRALGGVARA
jgi:hypothetical protein